MKNILPVIAIISSIMAIVIASSYHSQASRAEAEDLSPETYISNDHTLDENKLEKKVILMPPDVSASSVYVFDLKNNSEVLSKNPQLKVSPASTTKMMTALVALDTYTLDTELTAPKIVVPGSKMGIIWGEKINVESLLYGLLIKSANDAAEVLATSHPLGRDEFINQMNLKAKSLGMDSSYFVNPTGLDDVRQTTSARDMFLLGTEIIKNPFLARIVATSEASVYSANGNLKHEFKNTNQLLSDVDGVFGIKTGWTEDSGENLVTLVKREEGEYIVSIFDSPDRFEETKKIIELLYSSSS